MTAEDKIDILFNNLYAYVPSLYNFYECTDLEIKECFSNLHLLSKTTVIWDNLSVIPKENTKPNQIVHIRNLFICRDFEDIRDSIVQWSNKNHSGKLLTILIFQNADNFRYHVDIRVCTA